MPESSLAGLAAGTLALHPGLLILFRKRQNFSPPPCNRVANQAACGCLALAQFFGVRWLWSRLTRYGTSSSTALKYCEEINTVALATHFDRVNDRATFAGSGMTNKHPVLFAQRRRADRVLDKIIVDLQAPILNIPLQPFPLSRRPGPSGCAGAQIEAIPCTGRFGEGAITDACSLSAFRRYLP